MYKDDIEFYSLPERDKCQLINSKRAATAGGLLTELPEDSPAVRIFERPLDQLVLNRFEHGQYKSSELSDHFGVTDTDIRRIINRYRRRGTDDFTRENFKQHLLLNRNGIIRAKDSDGKALYYSIETIPFSARVIDPTLGFSLLDFDDRLSNFPRITPQIPGGKATELDEDYAFVVGDYWGIDPEEVFDYLTAYDRRYIDTSLIPLPQIPLDEYTRNVSERFRQDDAVYDRFRSDIKTVEKLTTDFINKAERGQAGIAAYQIISIDLADLQWYAKYSGDYNLQSVISEWVDKIADTLYPEEDQYRSEEEPAKEELNLEDEVRLVLSETPKTVTEIYEALPRDVRVGVDKSEVTETLDHLTKIGNVDRDDEEPSPTYCFARGHMPW